MGRFFEVVEFNSFSSMGDSGSLPPGWDEANGGALRLFDSLAAEPTHTELMPSGDRLVLFWSDLVVHEVLPCFETQPHGHRYTFTLWLTSDNPLVIGNPTDPLHALRETHYPRRDPAA